MAIETPKNFCIMPWVAIRANSNGQVKPCCVFRRDMGRLGQDGTLTEIWRGNKFRELRRKFLAGERPADCQVCWVREEKLGRSLRTVNLERFLPHAHQESLLREDIDPEFLEMDLNFGNVCNLKCRMCGSWGSIQWIDEDKQLNEIDPNFLRSGSRDQVLCQRKASDYSDALPWLGKLQRIDLKGGEPFLNTEHVKFLQMLIDRGISRQVKIAYMTNGTVVPTWAKEIFPLFKEVQLDVSLDGLDRVYQYIRGGERYSFERDVLPNLEFFGQFVNLRGSFSVTVQAYNAFDLINLANFIRGHTLKRFGNFFVINNLVVSPEYLQIDILPKSLQIEVALLLEEYQNNTGYDGFFHLIETLRRPQFRSSEDAIRLLKLFQKFTNELDRMRGTSLLKIEPRFAPAFNDISPNQVSNPKISI